jgi:hypothetical protein
MRVENCAIYCSRFNSEAPRHSPLSLSSPLDRARGERFAV